jgi:hypothetical protein
MFVARSPKIGAASLAGIGMIFAGMMAILLGIFGIAVAGATQPEPEHIITLCHATDSYSNPYVTESVDIASPLFQGHDGHDGPVFYAAIPKDTKWGDIIPAFDFGPGAQYAGKNWTDAGQAIQANDCTAPDAIPTTTTSTTPPEDTTTTSTTESTTTTTPVTVGGITTTPSTGPGTIGNLGDPNPSTPVTIAAVPAGSGTLPFTGSPVVFLLSLGGALIASGIGLIARRRHWAN